VEGVRYGVAHSGGKTVYYFVMHSAQTNYHVKTEVFEGPLDLLLSLIEKRKLFISDISLASVTDDYLRHLENHESGVPLAETAQFVLVGSTLLLIKSRSLLPVLQVTQEEQTSIDDLERRLHVLGVYRTVGKALQKQYGSVRLYRRRRVREVVPRFAPGATLSREGLHDAVRRVCASLPVFAQPLREATVEKVLSLDKMMEQLTERINNSMELSFKEFAGNNAGKVQVIVSFLAMLELVRQGVVRVEQGAHQEDIRISSEQVGTPKYA
jgi:segregation and condensation protein A